jgi:hypothetical protein
VSLKIFSVAIGILLLAGCAVFELRGDLPRPALGAELESFWFPAMTAAGILYQDGANPIQFPGGALWTFGDSFTGKWKPDGSPDYTGAVTNAAMLYRGPGDMEYLPAAKTSDGSLIPLQPPETWDDTRIWPAGGIYLNGDFYVYYSPVRTTGKGLGFEGKNSCGIAKSRNGDWHKWSRLNLSSALPFKEAPQSVLAAPDGFVYAYFVDKNGFDSRVRVARFRPENIANPPAYEILPGALADGVFGQVSVIWSSGLKSYVMCHAGNIFRRPRTLQLRFAKSPLGPFSKPVTVFSKPGSLGKDLDGAFYCAYLHPELGGKNSRSLWITYCIVNEKYGTPHLVRVDFAVGDK